MRKATTNFGDSAVQNQSMGFIIIIVYYATEAATYSNTNIQNKT